MTQQETQLSGASSFTFFIFDHTVLKKEEDDLKDAIIYYYPPVDADTQCALVGQLIGMAEFFHNTIPRSLPTLYKLQNNKFALRRKGDYTLSLGADKSFPDRCVQNRLDFLLETFVFYQGSLDLMKQNLKSTFVAELKRIWDIYIRFCNNFGDLVGQMFQILPTVDLPQTSSHLFLHASHILQRSVCHPTVLAGAILYRYQSLCTQLPPKITKLLLLLKPKQSHWSKCKIKIDFELPEGISLLKVYLSLKDYQQICPTRRPDGRRKSKSQNHATDLTNLNQISGESLDISGISFLECSSGKIAESLDQNGESFSSIKTIDESHADKREKSDEASSEEAETKLISTPVCDISKMSSDSTSDMKTDLVTQIVKDETDSKINQLDDTVVQQEEITLSHSPEVKKEVVLDTTSSEELSTGESFVDPKAMRSYRKHLNSNKLNAIITQEGSHETPSSTDIQKSQSDNIVEIKDIKVEASEIRISNSPSAFVDKNMSKIHSPSHIVGENASETPSLSVVDENASKTPSLSVVDENASKTPSLSVVDENASKTPSLSAVDENASKTPSLSVVDENASKTPSLSVVDENASKTPSLTVVDENVSKTPSLSAVDENASKTPSLSVVDENASKTPSPPAVVDENVVHIVLNVKKDEEEEHDDVDSKLQKSSGSSIASDETFSHNQDTLGFLSNPDSLASFDSMSPIPATRKAVTISYQSQTSEEIPQSSDNHFSSSTSNIDTSDSDAGPSSSDGIAEVVLYVQGHSDMMLLMFLDKDAKCEGKNITNLWKSSLSHLAELDFEMKECLNKAKNERQFKADQGYHFLKYDSFMRTLTGNTLDPITSIGYDYVNTAGKIHDSFTSSKTTNEVLFRTHTSCCYGSRTESKESFFQMNTAQRQPGGCPSPKDAAFVLDQIAVQKLQINQET